MKSRQLGALLLALTLGAACPLGVQAAVVGQFTEIVGRVDLMKAGKPPVIEVKLKDTVETGDIVRTKSEAKAQITFIDSTTMDIAPESRLGIETYMYDLKKDQRHAVLQIFRGLVHTVVSRVYQVQEPDFIMKTHTAVLGVRGTNWYAQLNPRFTDVANVNGTLRVQNAYAEVKGQVDLGPMTSSRIGLNLTPTTPMPITKEDLVGFQKTFAQATGGKGGGSSSGGGSSGGGSSQKGGAGSGAGAGGSGGSQSSSGGAGSGGGGAPSSGGQSGADTSGASAPASSGSTGSQSLSPTVSYGDPGGTPLSGPTGTGGTTGGGGLTGTPTGALQTSPANQANQNVGLQNQVTNTSSNIYVPPASTPVIPPPPPPPAPPPPPPAVGTYTFQQIAQSMWTSTADPSGNSNTVTSTGWAQRTGSWPAGTFPQYYTGSGTGARTVLQGSSLVSSTGVSSTTLAGTVTGVLGSTLTGTATLTGTSSFGQTDSFTGTVSINPSGQMTFTYINNNNNNSTISSMARWLSASGTTTYTPGTLFTQTLNGGMAQDSTTPYSVQGATTSPGAWEAGATTISGPLARYYALALTGTATSSWPYTYLNQGNGSLAGTMAGVVSPTSSGGLQGAATITPSDRDAPFATLLTSPPSPYLFGKGANDTTPVVTSLSMNTIPGPEYGTLTGEVNATDYQSGKYAQQNYSMTQTPQASPVTLTSTTYDFTQSYNGALNLNSGLTSSTLQAQGFGWGYRSGDSSQGYSPLPHSYGGSGYFAANDQGAWTLTSGSLPSPYGSTVGVTQMSGRVTGVMGQALTGNMTFIGSLLNGASFNYSGPATMDSNGSVKFTYTGNWTAPGGSGTASGTLSQWNGYYFTQTVPAGYMISSSNPSGGNKFYNASLSIYNNFSPGYRSGVYPVGIPNGEAGSLSFYSPDGSINYFFPGYSGATSINMQGVVTTADSGATYGAATLSLDRPFYVNIPGSISLTPGGSYFNMGGIFVRTGGGSILATTSPVNVQTGYLAQNPTWGFSETYQGFRVSTGSAPFTLANVEGYGWGQPISSNLPSNYTGSFVSQDLGTRASATAMTPGWAGVTGTLSGTLSGTAYSGSTLSGQMTFTGQNSLGTTFNYQGSVTLGPDGRLTFNYAGTWTNGANSGTGSGTWTQVLGTYFSQTVNSGTFVQVATPNIGGTTYNSSTVQDAAPLSGTQRLGSPTASPTNVTTSYAGIRTSTVNTFTSYGGTPNLTIRGVVAGSDWQNKWGVATISGSGSPTGSTGMSGPVTLDTSGKLTGQFVDVVPNGAGQPVDNVTVNLVSVPTGPGQTTSSFVNTVSGPVTQTPTGSTPSTQGSLTTPTPLSGTSSVSTSTGIITANINANLALTSTAASATYGTSGSGPMTAQIVGAVGGPAGGTQTGVASMHSFKTIGSQTHFLQHVGTAAFQPAAGSTPATLTATVNGLNLAPPPSPLGTFARQRGTVTVTPR